MNSKERVLSSFAHVEPDRVPCDYINWSGPGLDKRLKAHFGLAADDHEGLLKALNVDFRSVYPRYTGPKLHPDIPERGIKVNDWGIRTRWVENQSGGYWDYCDFPLANATEEEVAAWSMPSPDDFDYSGTKELCRKKGDYAVVLGDPSYCDIINGSSMLRGMEQVMIDLATDDPAGLLLAKRRTDIQLEMLRRCLEAANGGFDIMWIGEDLGAQHAPLISVDMYRKHLRPIHQEFVDLAKAYNVSIMMHSCGSSSWAFEDFIEMGIDAVDALQPEASEMLPAILKAKFGDCLTFHGCISTAGDVAYGTPADVTNACKETLEIMKPGGGYCFSPAHSFQDNSPTENVVAMYEAVRKFGALR